MGGWVKIGRNRKKVIAQVFANARPGKSYNFDDMHGEERSGDVSPQWICDQYWKFDFAKLYFDGKTADGTGYKYVMYLHSNSNYDFVSSYAPPELAEPSWNGLCPANKHGLDFEGQRCGLCEPAKAVASIFRNERTPNKFVAVVASFVHGRARNESSVHASLSAAIAWAEEQAAASKSELTLRILSTKTQQWTEL